MHLSRCAAKMWCKVGWVVCGVSHVPTLHPCYQPHDGPVENLDVGLMNKSREVT